MYRLQQGLQRGEKHFFIEIYSLSNFRCFGIQFGGTCEDYFENKTREIERGQVIYHGQIRHALWTLCINTFFGNKWINFEMKEASGGEQ